MTATLWYLAGVPPRLFSVNVDTDPSRRRGGGEEEGREAGFPMADALGIHKRGLSALSSSEESVVSLSKQWHLSIQIGAMHGCFPNSLLIYVYVMKRKLPILKWRKSYTWNIYLIFCS